jgi:sigma-B regulation protein RsbU (phosphoserine phosphatase)
MRAVQRYYADLVYWQYAALESGVHASFPGHAAYPAGFDPRSRHWYMEQRAQRRLTWSRPHTDATTRLTMVSVTMPLFAPDGGFVGVTGIDVRLTRLLHKVNLPSHLAPDSEVLLGRLTAAAAPERAFEIVARQRYVDTGGDWREGPRIEYFQGDVPAEYAALLEDMRASGNGFARIRHRGRLTQCVYRRFDPYGNFLLFLVPTEAAAAPAADAARHALEITRRQVGTLVPIAMGTALLTVLAALLGARAVTGPLQQLSNAVEAAAGGHFSTRVDIRSGDEMQVLGEHFNRMIPQIEAHARMSEALAVAQEIQQRLLPAEPPQSTVLDIHASCDYADETGGDYFDYLTNVAGTPAGKAVCTEERLGIAIGDVSGHGIGPALLMATARAFLHASRTLADDLDGELGRLNRSLAEGLHAGRYMTMCVLVFDPAARHVQWLSAGHGPAWCWRARECDIVELSGQDIPLGIDPNWHFAAPGIRELAPGDIYVLATDGLWEARGADGTRYGTSRLHACLAHHAADTAAGVGAALRASVLEFIAGRLHDDMTLVVVKVRASGSEADFQKSAS